MMARNDDEERIARFSEWLRQRPNSIDFWELVLTDERLVWCYVGQSYRSLLLRADMGERNRAAIADRPLTELETLAGENFAVPVDDLDAIRYVDGTRFRRARLEIKWTEPDDGTAYDGQMSLVSTSGAEPQREIVAALAEDSRFDHVDIEVETPGWSIL